MWTSKKPPQNEHFYRFSFRAVQPNDRENFFKTFPRPFLSLDLRGGSLEQIEAVKPLASIIHKQEMVEAIIVAFCHRVCCPSPPWPISTVFLTGVSAAFSLRRRMSLRAAFEGGSEHEMLAYVICVVLIQWIAMACIVRLYRFPDRRFSDVIPYLRPDHQAELLELFDPIKELNLAEALGHRHFRKEQLRRLHMAQECLAQRSHNARIFQEWSYNEARRAASMFNLEMSHNANSLTEVCFNYRVSACGLRLELYSWYLLIAVLPFFRVPRISSFRKRPSFDLIESYAAVEQAAEILASDCGRDYRRVPVLIWHREDVVDFYSSSASHQEHSFNLMGSYTEARQPAEHLACGGECSNTGIRTFGTVREGTTDATRMTEARILRRGL